MKEQIIFAWSSGKDSAMALQELQNSARYDIVALLSTVTQDYQRVSMHGVRKELLQQQSRSIGLPLEIVYIPQNSDNKEYEQRMHKALLGFQAKGVNSVAFGDIFLAGIREYREANLAKVGMRGVFPLWKKDTLALARAFIEQGFKAYITCVDSQTLDQRFSGRLYDQELLAELPDGVDPCGENGEFHSFVFDGPLFSSPLKVKKGEVVCRENRFYFCDLEAGVI
jgi:uncharacterized protein (TIGR00290 family)